MHSAEAEYVELCCYSAGEANGIAPGGTPDTQMQDASAEAPASEPAAAQEPAHASSTDAAASKERDKAGPPDANGTLPVSLTDAIPAGKLRMAAATALSAAAVRASAFPSKHTPTILPWLMNLTMTLHASCALSRALQPTLISQ